LFGVLLSRVFVTENKYQLRRVVVSEHETGDVQGDETGEDRQLLVADDEYREVRHRQHDRGPEGEALDRFDGTSGTQARTVPVRDRST
jgi:hypothetical protein